MYWSSPKSIPPLTSEQSSVVEPIESSHPKEAPSDGASMVTGLQVLESDPFANLEDEIFAVDGDLPTSLHFPFVRL